MLDNPWRVGGHAAHDHHLTGNEQFAPSGTSRNAVERITARCRYDQLIGRVARRDQDADTVTYCRQLYRQVAFQFLKTSRRVDEHQDFVNSDQTLSTDAQRSMEAEDVQRVQDGGNICVELVIEVRSRHTVHGFFVAVFVGNIDDGRGVAQPEEAA